MTANNQQERCDSSGWIGGNVAPWPPGGPKRCPGCGNCKSDYEDGWLLAPDGAVVDGPKLPNHNIAVVPASLLTTANRRIEELERELEGTREYAEFQRDGLRAAEAKLAMGDA